MSFTMGNGKISSYAREHDIPVTQLILETFKRLSDKTGTRRTLLAVCPNSEAVLEAALVSAGKANAPIAFAATLNQVDLDRGYTGWTQADFVERIAEYANEIGLSVPIIVALDHGGPWLKDTHSKESWSLEQTTSAVEESLKACIDAGYDLLHIDATVDKMLQNGESIKIDTVIERTVEFMRFSEQYRQEAGFSKIAYEVGTEEVHGGISDMSVFSHFMTGLNDDLHSIGLGDVKPTFIVGKVGTDLHTTEFDSEVARRLVGLAEEHGMFVKGHYTDYVSDPAEYPKVGMGGANVGPEFTEIEYMILLDLVEKEKQLSSEGKVDQRSNLDEVIKQAVVTSGRWEKWRHADELGVDFDELPSNRQRWLIATGCRYIWTDPRVANARRVLYGNLENNGYRAKEAVISRLSEAMMNYLRSFNLIDSVDLLERELCI